MCPQLYVSPILCVPFSSLCVPISMCPHLYMSPSLCVHISMCLHLDVSPSLCVPISRCPHLYMSPYVKRTNCPKQFRAELKKRKKKKKKRRDDHIHLRLNSGTIVGMSIHLCFRINSGTMPNRRYSHLERTRLPRLDRRLPWLRQRQRFPWECPAAHYPGRRSTLP